MGPVIAYFDGSISGENTYYGFIVYRDHQTYNSYGNKTILFGGNGLSGRGTSNESEYKSLIKCIKQCFKYNVTDITIFGDSKLIINQVNDTWKTKNERMIVYRDIARDLLSQFNSYKLKWIRREENKIADLLAKDAHKK